MDRCKDTGEMLKKADGSLWWIKELAQRATRGAKRQRGRDERDTRRTAANEAHRRCEAEATAVTMSRRGSRLQRHGTDHRRQAQARSSGGRIKIS